MDPIITILKQKGFDVISYLDDIILAVRHDITKDEISDIIKMVDKLVGQIGLEVN
jgi:hypothetical protein